MAFTSNSGNAHTAFAAIALIVCIAAVMAPVSAATRYVGGSPSLSAGITGTNEFSPGENATISLQIKNSGVSTMKQLDLGTIDYEDFPTTAKFTTVGLSSPNDAIIIKSDSQFVGDITSGGTGATVTFKAKISSNATIGQYQLPVTINYQYLNMIRQEKADVFEYTYNSASVTLPVTIRIKPEVKIAVLEAIPDPLSAGTEGYLTLKIRNDGPENSTQASVKLVRSGSSAIIPTDGSVFIGDFPRGGIVNCTFKITASPEAPGEIYPVDVVVTYTNEDGQIVSTRAASVGIPVDSKISFSVISTAPSLAAGSTTIIQIIYRNNGNTTTFDAQSRLIPHGDITIDGNVAYLGSIAPGSSAVATYAINAGTDAEPGTYTLDSTIRFRDALGNSQESDTVAVSVEVLPTATGTGTGLVIIMIVCILIAVAIGIVLRSYGHRKKIP